jgi:hypothetical protein
MAGAHLPSILYFYDGSMTVMARPDRAISGKGNFMSGKRLPQGAGNPFGSAARLLKFAPAAQRVAPQTRFSCGQAIQNET